MYKANHTHAVIVLMFLAQCCTYELMAQSRIFPSQRAQVEAHIAINPTDSKNLVATAIPIVYQTPNQIGYYYSFDGGQTWNGNDNISGTVSAGDPVVAFDPDGKAYLLYQVLTATGLYLHISTNGGEQWSSRMTVRELLPSDYTIDKPWMAISPVRNSGGFFDIYITHTLYTMGGSITTSSVSLLKSTDGGGSFQQVHSVSPSMGVGVQGSTVAVGPLGEVFMAWAELDASNKVTQIRGKRSADGGLTFANAFEITTFQIGAKISTTSFALKSGAVGIVDSYPRLAVDQSPGPNRGQAYVVWSGKQMETGNPDILMVRWKKNADGSFSWSPLQVIDGSANDQWMPAVSVGPDGVLWAMYYTSQQGELDPIYVELRYSTDGGQNFTSLGNIGTSTGFTMNTPGPGESFLGDYHGLTGWFGSAYAVWTESRDHGSDSHRQVYFRGKTISQQTIAGYQLVEVDQRDEQNLSFDKIGKWNQGAFTNYKAPHQFLFQTNSNEILRAKQDFKSGTTQKYNIWLGYSDVTNHNIFTIASVQPPITARFKSSENATIQVQLLDGVSGGTIEFRDPWLIDQTDVYGPKNRGTNALWYSKSSPFSLNATTEYKGVFLGQDPNVTNNYYSIRAPLTPLSGFVWQFLGWSSVNANLSSSQSYETPVVFTGANAMITAKYKAHLATSQPVSYSSQRKIARGGSSVPHVMTYESGGDIYYLRSTDGGATWSQEVIGGTTISHQEQVSEGDGKYSHPSIESLQDAITGGGSIQETYVVWEENPYNGTGYRIWARTRNESSQSWNARVLLHEDLSSHPSGGAFPVISKRFVFWQGPNGILWKGLMNPQATASLVPGTDVNSTYPSIDFYLGGMTDGTAYLAWEQTNTGIRFCSGTVNAFGPGNWGTIKSISDNTGSETHTRPVIVRDNTGNACVAWEYRNTSLSQGNIKFRKVDLSGTLSSVSTIPIPSGSTHYPSMPSLSDNRNASSNQDDLTLVWCTPADGVYCTPKVKTFFDGLKLRSQAAWFTGSCCDVICSNSTGLRSPSDECGYSVL